ADAAVSRPREDRSLLGYNCFPELLAQDRRRQRYVATGEFLAHRHDVREYSIMFESAPRPAPAGPTHHLVGDHEHVMPVTDSANGLRVSGRSRHHTACWHDDRLENARRHVPSADSTASEPLDEYTMCSNSGPQRSRNRFVSSSSGSLVER